MSTLNGTYQGMIVIRLQGTWSK